MSTSKDMLVSDAYTQRITSEFNWTPAEAYRQGAERMRDAMKSDLDEALGALKDAQETFLNIGPGADIDADPDDKSPDDSIAHEAGLAYQRIAAILAKHSKEVTDSKG